MPIFFCCWVAWFGWSWAELEASLVLEEDIKEPDFWVCENLRYFKWVLFELKKKKKVGFVLGIWIYIHMAKLESSKCFGLTGH